MDQVDQLQEWGRSFLLVSSRYYFGIPLMILWNMRDKSFFQGETLPLERAHMVADSASKK